MKFTGLAATAGLAEKWPADGPRQLWKRPLGDGYSTILYKGGDLFTAYRDGDKGVVVCLDAGTGYIFYAAGRDAFIHCSGLDNGLAGRVFRLLFQGSRDGNHLVFLQLRETLHA